MGLDASNARMQTLVARLSDIHFRGQELNNTRLLIAASEQELSTEYSDALSKTKLVVKSADGTQNEFTVGNLQAVANTVICTPDGNPIPANTNADLIVQGLKNGSYQAHKIASGGYNTAGNWSGTVGAEYNWSTSTDSQIESVSDTDGQETAQMKYDSKLGELQPKDKQMEMELKNLDTEAQAIQTEIDAVKKVIDKDIEMTFKTFGNG